MTFVKGAPMVPINLGPTAPFMNICAAAARVEMATEGAAAGFTRRGDQHEHAEGQGSRPPSRALRQQRRGRRWRRKEQRLASHVGVISTSTPRGKAAGQRAGRCGSSGDGGDGDGESSGWLHTTR